MKINYFDDFQSVAAKNSHSVRVLKFRGESLHLKLTARTWKWMVGIRSFPFGARPIFRCELLVLGRRKLHLEFLRQLRFVSFQLCEFLQEIPAVSYHWFGFTMIPMNPHDGSMGQVYMPTWMVDFYGKLVGKYTSPMDPMGDGHSTLG